MRALRAFGAFWYDFVVGDDPKIAATVVLALTVLTALLLTGALSDHVLAVSGAVLVAAGFVAALALDVRRSRD